MEMEIYFPGNLRVDSNYRGFTMHTDQSRENGGDGSAPEPFDFFLSSIGTCTGVYILYFCRNRSIDATDIKLMLRFDRNAKTHMVENVSIKILLPEDFPDRYREALIRTAELCSVKKHLAHPPAFDIQAVKN